MHIWPAAVAKDLLTRDFEQCFRLCGGLRASLEKDVENEVPGAQNEAKMGSRRASRGLSWGRLRGSWAVPGWLQGGRDLPQPAQPKSRQVQKLWSCQVMN